jgi:hypothetical protein
MYGPKCGFVDPRNAEAMELLWQSLQLYVDALGDQGFRFQKKRIGASQLRQPLKLR